MTGVSSGKTCEFFFRISQTFARNFVLTDFTQQNFVCNICAIFHGIITFMFAENP